MGLQKDVLCSVEHNHLQVIYIDKNIVDEWLAPEFLKTFLEAVKDTDDRTKMVIERLDEMDKR